MWQVEVVFYGVYRKLRKNTNTITNLVTPVLRTDSCVHTTSKWQDTMFTESKCTIFTLKIMNCTYTCGIKNLKLELAVVSYEREGQYLSCSGVLLQLCFSKPKRKIFAVVKALDGHMK